MTRRHWRVPHLTFEQGYGLGTSNGALNGWEWFGHGGGVQGTMSRTAAVPEQGIAVSVLVNGIDGLAGPWMDGTLHLLQAQQRRGPPKRNSRIGPAAGGRYGAPSTCCRWAIGCSWPPPASSTR